MSLLLMPTEVPSPRGLSPFGSWRPLSRRSSKSPFRETSPNPGGLLVPKPTSKSSGSDDSRSIRSIRSSASRGGRLIRRIANRFRSSSNAGLPISPLKEIEKLETGASWLEGFPKYNQLVTDLVSRDPSFTPEQFAKVQEVLIKKSGGGFVNGLPEAVFDLALLWCPAERTHRRENMTEPSWSWMGWEKDEPKGVQAAVNFPFDPTTCPDVQGGKDLFFKSEIQRYKIGPVESESESPDPTPKPYTIRRDRKLRIGVSPYVPHGDDSAKDSRTLRFEADAISINKFTPKQIADGDRDIPYSELIDENDRQCGVIMEYADLISKPCSQPSRFDFILLSRTRYRQPSPHAERPTGSTVYHPPGTPLWDGEGFVWDKQVVDHDETIYESGEWNMLNVMLIQTFLDEEGKATFSERVAIGRIHVDAWRAQDPKRKNVVLR